MMIHILTPSLAFLSSSLSRRYLGMPGLRKLSSVPDQSNHENSATWLVNTHPVIATSRGYRSYLSQAESHVIGSRSNLAAKN